MTRARWAGVMAYFCLTFGGSLIGHGLAHNWRDFPIDAGIYLTVAGVLLFVWIRPS